MIKRIFIYIAFLLTLTFCPSYLLCSSSKSFSYIDSLSIHIDIYPDGSFKRIEKRKYIFFDRKDAYKLTPFVFCLFYPYESLNGFSISTSSLSSNAIQITSSIPTVNNSLSLVNCNAMYNAHIDTDNIVNDLLVVYETYTMPIINNNFWDILSLEELYPIKEANISISLPDNYDIFFDTYVSEDIKPDFSITNDNLFKVYQWSFGFSEIKRDSIGTILISSNSSWDTISSWFNDQYMPLIHPSHSFLNWAQNTFQDKVLTNTAIVNNVLKFIILNVASNNIGKTRHPYIPNSPEYTLDHRSGDCKDIAVLLVSILRSLSIESYLVLTNDFMNVDIAGRLPSPYHFNHALVYLPIQRDITAPFIIDPTIHLSNNKDFSTNYHDGLLLDGARSFFVDLDNVELFALN